MKKLIIALALVILLLVPAACASAPSQVAPAPAPMPPGMTEADEGYKNTGAGALPANEERMIVRTGDISLVVKDVVGT